MAGEFTAGFRSLTQELTDVSLPIQGTLPAWLSGRLVRNGPAQFEVAGNELGGARDARAAAGTHRRRSRPHSSP